MSGEASRDCLLPLLPWFSYVDDLGRYYLLVTSARVENGIKNVKTFLLPNSSRRKQHRDRLGLGGHLSPAAVSGHLPPRRRTLLRPAFTTFLKGERREERILLCSELVWGPSSCFHQERTGFVNKSWPLAPERFGLINFTHQMCELFPNHSSCTAGTRI